MVVKLRELRLAGAPFPSRIAMLATVAACGLSVWLILKLRGRSPDAQLGKGGLVQGGEPDKADAQILLQDDDRGVSTCKACQELIAVYERVGHQFTSGGLDANTIKAIQPWFHGVKEEGVPWPKKYEDFPEPLPHGAVRLLVIPLDDSPSLAATAAAITKDVLQLLPRSAKVFCNARNNYHCTVFHTSHPTDTRPDPFVALTPADAGLPASKRAGPTQATLDAETEAIAGVVRAGRAPSLVVDRVVMAASGTLLITWVDPSGHLADLRMRLRQAFPGACSKQASIIHSSLLRIVSEQQLDQGTVQAVSEACEAWTRKLRGRVFTPSATWWIHESEFSTIVGDKVRMKFTYP